MMMARVFGTADANFVNMPESPEKTSFCTVNWDSFRSCVKVNY
jgi:hypothetical protein